MHNLTTNLHIYALKSANSAVIPLTNPLTLYNSPHYDLYKYTEVKISSYYENSLPSKSFHRQFCLFWKLKLAKKFCITFPIHWNTCAPYKKTIQILKVFVCGGGDIENFICFFRFRVMLPSWISTRNNAKTKTDPDTISAQHTRHGTLQR